MKCCCSHIDDLSVLADVGHSRPRANASSSSHHSHTEPPALSSSSGRTVQTDTPQLIKIERAPASGRRHFHHHLSKERKKKDLPKCLSWVGFFTGYGRR